MRKTKEQISYNMRMIRGKNTKIEVLLRLELWHRGLRYRKNTSDICGRPDIVFKGRKIAVFCDGEFWHGYDWENRKSDIKSHQEYWVSKIERNMERDREVNAELKKHGWTVLRFWGMDIKKNLSECADIIEKSVLAKTENTAADLRTDEK